MGVLPPGVMYNSVARDGDSTSHGGVVFAIQNQVYADNLRVITIGATHICPVHGVNCVVQGTPHVQAEGIPISRIGHACACGAVIVSGSPTTKEG